MNFTVYIENGDVTISDLPDDLVSMMIALGDIFKTSCDTSFGDDFCG